MTKADLLNVLKDYTEEKTKDFLFPVKPQKEDGDTPPPDRPLTVYRMRLPSSGSATKKAPYVIHQIITGKDARAPSNGNRLESRATVRSIFCVYNENEEEGALSLLGAIERLRISFLKDEVLAKRYQLDLDAGVEMLIYPDDTFPHYAGEMISVWKLPSIEREVFPRERK